MSPTRCQTQPGFSDAFHRENVSYLASARLSTFSSASCRLTFFPNSSHVDRATNSVVGITNRKEIVMIIELGTVTIETKKPLGSGDQLAGHQG